MKTTKERKQEFVREVRKTVRGLRQDPYIAADAKYIVVELYKWQGGNYALVRVRDTHEPITTYDSDFCGYTLVYLHENAKETMWRVFDVLNKVLANVRHKRENVKNFQ